MSRSCPGNANLVIVVMQPVLKISPGCRDLKLILSPITLYNLSKNVSKAFSINCKAGQYSATLKV